MWRLGGIYSLVLNLSIIWGWVARFTPKPLYPRRVLATHWSGVWVGLRGGTDALKKNRIPCSCQARNPDSPNVQAVSLSPYRTYLLLSTIILYLFQCVGTVFLGTTQWPFWDATSCNYCIRLYSCWFLDYFHNLNNTFFEMLILSQFVMVSDIWHHTYV